MKTPAPVKEGNEVAKPGRRAFLQGSGLAAGAAVVGGTTLATLAAHTARANSPGYDGDRHGWSFDGYRSEYGALEPTPDQDGNHILALPPGFQYVTFSKIGDKMSDGNICPRAHDGMTCLEGRGCYKVCYINRMQQLRRCYAHHPTKKARRCDRRMYDDHPPAASGARNTKHAANVHAVRLPFYGRTSR